MIVFQNEDMNFLKTKPNGKRVVVSFQCFFFFLLAEIQATHTIITVNQTNSSSIFVFTFALSAATNTSLQSFVCMRLLLLGVGVLVSLLQNSCQANCAGVGACEQVYCGVGAHCSALAGAGVKIWWHG